MAMPISAWARAGASLTPSPTIATQCPVRLQPLDLGGLVLRAAPRRAPGRCRASPRRPRRCGGCRRSAARSRCPAPCRLRTAAAADGLTGSITAIRPSSAGAGSSAATHITVRPCSSSAVASISSGGGTCVFGHQRGVADARCGCRRHAPPGRARGGLRNSSSGGRRQTLCGPRQDGTGAADARCRVCAAAASASSSASRSPARRRSR